MKGGEKEWDVGFVFDATSCSDSEGVSLGVLVRDPGG